MQKQENVTPQSTERMASRNRPQNEITDKDFKVTTVNMFMDLMNRWESQLINVNYKNESNGNSRTENYKIRN